MPSPFQFATRAGVLLLGLMVSSPTTAQQLTREQSDFFENRIRPIFVNNCYKCHSQQAPKLKGGLSLETRDGWSKGGDNGPVVVPGDPEKSVLIKAVRYTNQDLQMPPKGQKLSDAKIADLEAWVKMGAPDPRVGSALAANKSPRDHWSFKPIDRKSVV